MSALLNPESWETIGSSTPETCDATLVRVRVTPFEKTVFNNGVKEKGWVIAAKMDYVPDEESGLSPFSDYLKLGNLSDFSPADGDGEEIELPPVDELSMGDLGKYEGVRLTDGHLNPNTKFAEWVILLTENGVTLPDGLRDFRFFEGIEGYWETVEMRPRVGLDFTGKIFALQSLHEHHQTKKGKKSLLDKEQEDDLTVKERLVKLINNSLDENSELSRPFLNRLVSQNFDGKEVGEASHLITLKRFWASMDTVQIVNRKVVRVEEEDLDF